MVTCIEWGANDSVIFAKCIYFWDRHVGVVAESLDDAVLSLDCVSSARQQLSWRLLAQHVALLAILSHQIRDSYL